MIVIQPATLPSPPVPLSPGVRSDDVVFVSGQVASHPDGTVLCGSFEDEVNLTLDNVETILAGAGATFADVVKVGAYVSNSLLFAPFNEIYARRYPNGVFPARTTLVVSFGHPDVRVEVEAIASLAPGRGTDRS